VPKCGRADLPSCGGSSLARAQLDDAIGRRLRNGTKMKAQHLRLGAYVAMAAIFVWWGWPNSNMPGSPDESGPDEAGAFEAAAKTILIILAMLAVLILTTVDHLLVRWRRRGHSDQG
jgi:hypothetical protein